MNSSSMHNAARAVRAAVSAIAIALLFPAAVGASAADAPTGLSVAAIDYTQAACNIDGSAQLSWTAPAGSPTGYNVYRRIAANENPTLAGTDAAPTTTYPAQTHKIGQS